MSERLKTVIEEIDKINAEDPTQEANKGNLSPKELIYGQRMTEMLFLLETSPGEELQIAARGQHIKRWEIPRNSYSMDKKGYLKWRTDLKNMHAKLLGEIMVKTGYDEKSVLRASNLVTKRKLKTDEESKTLEDAVCLVFLKFHLTDFSKKHPEEKVIDILQKTWKKMTPKGHELALNLDYNKESSAIIGKAKLN